MTRAETGNPKLDGKESGQMDVVIVLEDFSPLI